MTTSWRIFRFGFLVGLQDFSIQWNPLTWLGGYALRVVTQGIFFALLGKLIDSEVRLHYLIVGQAVVVGATNAMWAMYGSLSDRMDGTYPLLVAAPRSMLPALAGRTAIWIASGVASSSIAFVVLITIFAVDVPWPAVLLVFPLIATTCAGSYCLALFAGTLLVRVPHMSSLAINIASVGAIAICGVSVPVDYWPVWVEALATMIPLTHGLEAVRIVLAEGPAREVVLETSYLVALSALWLALSVIALDRLTDSGRADGSIEFAG
jgi:ABC-2 type transport system permease protein